MALSIEDLRVHLRVSTDAFDAEIQALADAAKRDMERVGIKASVIGDDPLANIAVITFVKARFGFDNPSSQEYEVLYRQAVADLLNSSANIADTDGE